MKRIISLALLTLLLISSLLLTSCGGFFSEPEMKIKSITSDSLPDGSLEITITYQDERTEPTVFIIPPGKDGIQGENGNGIKDVTYKHDESGKKTNILITFTDTSVSPVSFSVPDGLSVIGVSDGTDANTGEKYIAFKYSDGTSSDKIYLQKGEKGSDGKDGVDGNGIKNYEVTPNADKSVHIKFELDDGRLCEIDIPAPEKGNGIKTMISRTETSGYYIDVVYDNGDTETLQFDRPTKWLRGNSAPSKIEGADGDYFFDVMNKIIYMKFGGSWVSIVDFETSAVTCQVKFDLNANGSATLSGDNIFFITRGEYFASYGYTGPVPERAGYTFLGWYTERTSNPGPTIGAFTNLTPVMCDLVLYAAWAPNN